MGCNGSGDASTAAQATGTQGTSAQATGAAAASGSAAGSSSSAGPGSAASAGSTGPSLTGTAITTAMVGTAYSFQPQASDPNNAPVTFSITNKPAWAAFNTATGQLSGTPSGGDVGNYGGIQISATDGSGVASLPAFAIAVSAPAAGASGVNLTWSAVTQNSDGTPVTDLQGYKIHYGTQSQNYTGAISVDNPTLTTYLVNSLPAGKYYFAVTAYNSAGLEGPPSDEITATFN